MKRPFFRIQPGYEGCLGYCSIDNRNYGCVNDTIEIKGYESTPFTISGIEAWCWEWDREAHKAKENEPSDFNWEDWHIKGLHLAQLLRQVVPDDIEIFYRKGNEDILLDKFRYFCMFPDACSLVGDTNYYSICCYDDDIFEIGYFPPIYLNGIDRWWRDFDSHVDYVDATADSDFDWISWYVKGLKFAKLIRQNLPASIEIWYRIPFELSKLLPIPDQLVTENGSFLIRDFQTATHLFI